MASGAYYRVHSFKISGTNANGRYILPVGKVAAVKVPKNADANDESLDRKHISKENDRTLAMLTEKCAGQQSIGRSCHFDIHYSLLMNQPKATTKTAKQTKRKR